MFEGGSLEEPFWFLGLGIFDGRGGFFPCLFTFDFKSRFFQNESVIARVRLEFQLQLLSFFNVRPFFQTNLSVCSNNDRRFSLDRGQYSMSRERRSKPVRCRE